MSHQTDNDNICAGTQVVALTEVRGTTNTLVHPRATVGVVSSIVARAKAETKLPERPDYEAGNWFFVQARRQMANHKLATPQNLKNLCLSS